jgi:hypothetical protein
LAYRINLDVWKARAAKVAAQLNDEGSIRVRRRRCAEICADYLLENLDQ